MSRPIVLSNGSMHVGIDPAGLVHDFYFPYVGLENHLADRHLYHRIGVWVEGKFSWLDNGQWEVSCTYYDDTQVSKIIAKNDELQVRLEFDDCVDSEYTVFLRNIHVINYAPEEREVRLFMHQVFRLSDSSASGTAQYLPEQKAIIHYKGHRVMLVNGCHSDGPSFDSYSVGLFGSGNNEGTYRDAEDGELMRNNVEHGRVDSVLSFHLRIKSHSSRRVHYWIVAANSVREAHKLNNAIQETGLLHHLLKTANWWSEWSRPIRQIAKKLPEQYKKTFVRSALVLKSHLDKHGAVIASTDSTMLNYERDAYAYCWPRDAAYVLWPLIRMGYTDEALRFFSFARRSLASDGYLSHKYQADGALGSSWHPYLHRNNDIAPPIQTDETATVLFLFGQYYRKHQSAELLKNYYILLIKPIANFLSGYVNEEGLPLPSYDLWEEKYIVSTYTTAVTFASLKEAAYLAKEFGETESAERWDEAAERMQEQRISFVDDDTGYFYKGFLTVDGTTEYDKTIDSSSLYGAFMYGYFPLDSIEIKTSYQTLKRCLASEGYKIIRYENDNYRRLPGQQSNPWPVTSLWYAQYSLETGDQQTAEDVLDWINKAMYPSGVIAEQYSLTDEPLSVAPLAWSQAEYINTLLDMITEPEVTE